MKTIQVVPTPPPATWEAIADQLPQGAKSDRPVLAAAIACSADTVITGNTRDFGQLIATNPPTAGIPTVLTPRAFLLRGPLSSASEKRMVGRSQEMKMATSTPTVFTPM